MSVHVEYMENDHLLMQYTDERNLYGVEDPVARDVFVIGNGDSAVVFTGPKEKTLAWLRQAIEIVESGALLYEPEQCGECGRFFDTLEDLEAHEAELDGK